MSKAAFVRRPASITRYVATILLVALLPLIVWSALGASAIALPPDERVREVIKRDLGDTRDPVELLRRAQADAVAHPLNPAAFFVAAAAAEQQGRTDRALSLMQEVAR
nr:hypothetical protein [Pseudomonadota bacterium]